MPRPLIESDEDNPSQAEEIDGNEDANPASRKRIQKPSTKQKEIVKGNLEAEMKKLERMQKKVKNMQQQQRKEASKKGQLKNVKDKQKQQRKDDRASKKGQRHGSDVDFDDDDDDDEFESEEDINPNTLGFSSSIQPLTIENANDVSKKSRTPAGPLKRVGAAAARIPQAKPHISANAFKVIPTSTPIQNPSHQEQATEVSLNTDEEPEPEPENEGSFDPDVSASKSRKCSRGVSRSSGFCSSTPVTRTSSPFTRSSSPVAHSSLPVQVAPLQKKAKSQKRSHDEFRSSSPTNSFRSYSPVAHHDAEIRSSSPVIPLQKKVKKGSTIPAYREGAEINHKKPKASDYEDVVQALILRAASQYEAAVSTQDSFPDMTQRVKWARKSWSDANKDADHEYEITDEISSMLRKRGSRIRGYALTVIRPLVVNVFGFKRGSDPRVTFFNQTLCASLKAGSAFHYKDIKALTGYAQGRIISEILQAVWFENKTSLGVIFEKQFNPIPFETLALILTIIDFCLDEWSSGTFNKATLWEKNIIARHEVFRADLKNWGDLNSPVVAAIRKKLYFRACRNAGVITEARAKQNLVGEAMDRARAELDGRTGETDSELEMEPDEEPVGPGEGPGEQPDDVMNI